MTVEIYNGASFYRFEMMDFDVSDGGGGGGGTANGSKIYLVERFVIGTELAWNLTMGDLISLATNFWEKNMATTNATPPFLIIKQTGLF